MIYVDDALIKATVNGIRDHWSHLFASTDDEDNSELIAFGRSIGLKPSWLQRGAYIHFDVTISKRKAALRAGATSVMTREALRIMCRGLTRVRGDLVEGKSEPIDTECRIIEKVELLGVSVVEYPPNPHCRFDSELNKSIKLDKHSPPD